MNGSVIAGQPTASASTRVVAHGFPRLELTPAVGAGFATLLILGFGLPGLFLYAHPYTGVRHDALLYAAQALRHLEPAALGGDLFFRHGSQDSFTVFTPLYASLIRLLGLEPAAYLVARCTLLCLCATAWILARRLAAPDLAWLSLALFIVIPGIYGSDLVFSYSEEFATPRALAESLVLGSLALHLDGRGAAALVAVGIAFLFHPLMAVPGLLVGAFAVCSRATGARLLAAGIAAVGAATAIAQLAPVGPLRLIDPEWRQGVLYMGADYLFVDEWRLADWQPSILTLVSLAAALLLLPRGMVWQLARAALLVGIAGLVLASFSSIAAPVAIIIQGQPWRWIWLGKALSVLLLAPTATTLWQRGASGRGVLALLAASWLGTTDPVGVASALCALLAVFVEMRGSRRWAAANAWLAPLLALVFVAARWHSGDLLPQAPVAIAAVIAWFIVTRCGLASLRSAAILATTAFFAVQAVAAASDAGRSFAFQPQFDQQAYRAFAPWRARIRPDQTVFYPGGTYAVWLLLHRKSYGAYVGAVFSRDAAMEVREREATIREFYSLSKDSTSHAMRPLFPPLTPELLRRICRVSEIDFVVSADRVPLPHLSVDTHEPFDHLNLYACTDVPPSAAP